eukprot:1139091-Pelagomonas_calceolata.AAC.7
MPIEKGSERDYVTLVQHEGTDGMKQGKNKRFVFVSWRCCARQATLLASSWMWGGQVYSS